MNNQIIAFGNNGLKKRKFHYSKYSIRITKVDIDKIITSNKVSFGKKSFKYFIGYKDDEKIEALCIRLPLYKNWV